MKDFTAGREVPAIVGFATSLYGDAGIEPEVTEILSQEILDEQCLKAGQTICILNFFPNIYDGSADERRRYLKIIKNVYRKQINSPFTFFWLQSGDQLDLERQLNLGFGFPAIVAISPVKKKWAVQKASFSTETLNSFLNGLLSGSESLNDLKFDIKIKTVEAWDGNDAPKIEEEPYSEEL